MNSHDKVCLTVKNICFLLILQFFLVNLTYSNENTNPIIEQQLLNNTLELILQFEKPILKNSQFGDQKYTVLSVLSLQMERRPGFPRIPYYDLILVIPPHGQILVQEITSRSTSIELNNPIVPVFEFSKQIATVKEQYSPQFILESRHYLQNKIYSTEKFFPREKIGEPYYAWYRNFRIASIRINPIIYDIKNEKITLSETIKLSISFPGMNSIAQSTQTENKNKFSIMHEKNLAELVVNPEMIHHYKNSGELVIEDSIMGRGESEDTTNYRLVIEEDGWYKIMGNDFLNSGIPINNIDPRSFKLFLNGDEKSIRLTGDGDGIFDPLDSIEFFCTSINSAHTDDTVLWLESGGDFNGLRIEERNENPAVYEEPESIEFLAHIEENHLCAVTALDMSPDEELWYWNSIASISSKTYNFDLAHLDLSWPDSIALKIRCRGVTRNNSVNPDHKARVTLNSNLLGTFTFEDIEIKEKSFSFPVSYAQELNNELVVEALEPEPGIFQGFMVDWFEVTYGKKLETSNKPVLLNCNPGNYLFTVTGFDEASISVFDVTNSLNPVELSNLIVMPNLNTYQVSWKDVLLSSSRYYIFTEGMINSPKSLSIDQDSQLKLPKNQADLIIITHDDFFDQAVDYATIKTEEGFVTKVVRISDVYDEWNYGQKDPDAIKAFLTYAYEYWQEPTFSYVLLFGDASYDPKDYFGGGNRDYIPTKFFDAAYTSLGTTDHFYSCLSGTDHVSDVFLGRIPVGNTTQAQNFVDKTIIYKGYDQNESWTKNIMLLSDNTDSAGCFECANDFIADKLNSTVFIPNRMNLSDFSNGTECRDAILTQMNDSNLAAAIINYYGHGSIQYLANEQILGLNDLPNVENETRLPFLLSMTCYNSYFAIGAPSYECMSEAFVEEPYNGAIGVIGCSGLSYLSTNQYLNQLLFDALLADPNYRIGHSFVLAKNQLALSAFPPDEVFNTIFLGDPTLQLKLRPQPAVPALSEWAMGLVLLLMSGAFVVVRRRM